MTLNDFVTYVCLQLNRTSNDDRAACAAFVDNAYDKVYDAYPWRDSEIIASIVPVPGSVQTQGTFAFPSGMERIVKIGLVSTAGGSRAITDLRPSDSAALLETRPDVLAGATGTPEFYEEIYTTSGGRVINVYPAFLNGSQQQLLVIGKKTRNALVNSTDTPILRNTDDPIIQYALAAMLKRDRQYAKAQVQMKEADEILQATIELEQKQSNAPRAARPLSVTGGTLSELTDAVASRLGLWDAASENKIKEAIRRLYQELYDRELWTESVVILSEQAQGGILIMPDFVDRVITVNNNGNLNIEIVELEYLFRTNPEIFNSTGTPVVFSLLPPVGVRVLPASAEQLSLISNNINDSFSVSVYGESNGLIFEELVNVTNGAAGITAYSYDVPLRISKPTSLGTLTVSGASSLTKFADIPANQSSVQYQRVWVQPIDSTTANDYYFVLGKRRLQQLINAVDAITVPRGCENALINLACSELAPDSATRQEFAAKAESQIQTLINRETNQNARRATVTPYTERSSCLLDGTEWMTG